LQVRWEVWDAVDEPYLARSRELTRGRVLLECQYGWFWYLGDRVLRQSIRADKPQVPRRLPPRVLMTSRYTLAEIERYTTPDLDLRQYLRPALSYIDYRSRYLAGPLRAAEWMERMEREKAAKARASAGGVAGGEGTGTSSQEIAGARWWVRVTSAGGEIGDIDIPRPPADFSRLAAPVRNTSFFQFVNFNYDCPNVLDDSNFDVLAGFT
jgi:hypothetical protein